tara:strand:- start:1686 stop:2513 length:828 start_codon:yes stop_codon:yes gene_type:complete
MPNQEKVTSISTSVNKQMGKWKYPWCGMWIALPFILFWETSQTGWGDEFPFITMAIGAILILYIARITKKVRIQFWKDFAQKHGWTYSDKGDASNEKALLLSQARRTTIQHVINGTFEDRPMRIFEMSFTIGSGDDSETYFYTVFEFTMKGAFPHIYLDKKSNQYKAKTGNAGVRIPLPTEFAKKYNLYAPEQYEIEALEIFNEDVMQYILDEEFPHDVEIVDAEVLIFRDYHINTVEELEKEYQAATKLLQKIEKRLDRSKLYTIGDKPHEMKR